MKESRKRTRELNDEFRKWPTGRGRLMLTDGVVSKGRHFMYEAHRLVREFDDFNADNDPYHEHDFGSIQVQGEVVFWKIDYFDPTMAYGSQDPNDPDVTMRVLTIMLAEEY